MAEERGKVTRSFGVNKGSEDSQIVDSILVWIEGVVKDGNEGTAKEKRERFYSELVDVEYTFTDTP